MIVSRKAGESMASGRKTDMKQLFSRFVVINAARVWV